MKITADSTIPLRLVNEKFEIQRFSELDLVSSIYIHGARGQDLQVIQLVEVYGGKQFSYHFPQLNKLSVSSK